MDHNLAKALSHPVRIEILDRLSRETASPIQLSRALDRDLSKVCYHIKVLRDAGLIHQVKTEPVRGATEHFYRSTSVANAHVLRRKEIPRAVRGHVAVPTMQAIIEEGVAAIETGTIDAHEESQLVCIAATLDQKGCREVSAAIDQALKKVIAAQERSAKRLAKADKSGIPATFIVANFESARTGRGKPR